MADEDGALEDKMKELKNPKIHDRYQISCFDGTNLIVFLRKAKANNWRIEVEVVQAGTIFRAYTDEATCVQGISTRETKATLVWPGYIAPWPLKFEDELGKARTRASKILQRASRGAQVKLDAVMFDLEDRIVVDKYLDCYKLLVEKYEFKEYRDAHETL